MKEAMRMYEGTLSASFDMEEEYDRVADKLQVEVDQLKEKKAQLQEDQKALGRAHDRTSAELEVAMDCKDALEARWKKVKEIGNLT
jgi:Skp family chaperone for outer membrane proteins